MKLSQLLASFIIATFAITACKGKQLKNQSKKNELISLSNEGLQVSTIKYLESDEDFPNPERGYYRYSATSASNFSALDINTLKGYRELHNVSNASYHIYSTLLFRYYVFDKYTDGPISAKTLAAIQQDMNTIRAAGLKLIPRFVYSIKSTKGDCPEGFICPPYGDAPKEIIIGHIRQLKTLLHKNADVIAVVQLGLFGTWGENYYTDYFGDASSNGGQGNKLTDQNWLDRSEVLKELLDAVPEDRMVQIRYPQFKQRYLHGVNAEVDTKPMSEQQAFTNQDIARIGFHNDCFLSGPNDTGTFADYGNSNSERASGQSVVDDLRNYKIKDSKFVAIGGETCRDTYNPYNDCEPAGRAQEEMALMHYSFLNANYNNDVNNDWQDGGCMDNIKKNLGYRFVLKEGVYQDEVQRGQSATIRLELENKGYASPYNSRPVQILLKNNKTGDEIKIKLNTDIRRWFPGEILVNEKILIPNNLPTGDYSLFLALNDPYESIENRSEYSIRLANLNTWDETTGSNNLKHSLKIK